MATVRALCSLLRRSVAILVLGGAADAAFAQSLHVKEADFEAGQWNVESINGVQQGFPRNADRVRTGHELGIGYGITAAWQLKGLVSFATPDEETTRIQRVMMENVVVLRALEEGKNGFGIAWFHALEGAVARDETNVTIFGPSIILREGKTELALNPFFEKSFGRNHTPGMDFLYGWQARRELSEHVSIGIEGYGRIPEIGSGMPLDVQEHRIGPVLILKTGAAVPVPGHLGALPTSHRQLATDLELGVQFGLTEATPDMAFKANLHFNY